MKNFFTISAFILTAALVSVYSAGLIAKSNRMTRESYESGIKKEIDNFTLAMNNANEEIAKLQEENKTLTTALEEGKKTTTKKPATTPAKTTTTAKTTLTAAVVAKHGTQADCWLIVSGKVYSVSSYISMHPGGKSTIVNQCGKDATTVFTNRGGTGSHSKSAWSMLDAYLVGKVGASI